MSVDRTVFEGERAFRLLVQGVVDYAIFMLDSEGVVATWNVGAQRIKGYSTEEIVGRHFSTFYPPEDRAIGLPEKALATARRYGKYEAEGWRLRKDGSRFFASVVIDPLYENGELVGFAKITRDITERLKARSALDESESRFRLFVAGVTDYALYMLDPAGIITNWNLGGQRIKGYLPDEIVGQHFSRFYTAADQLAGKPARALEIARENGRYDDEGLRVRKDGSVFWASVVIDPIRDDSGELIGFAKITRDITERHEAQQRVERIQRQLAESQKMDALGQLTGGVAHDFNNLLMVVSASAQTLKRTVSDKRGQMAIQAIEKASDRGAGLTRQLLSFARRQHVRPEVIDVGRSLGSLSEVLKTAVGATIDMIVDVPRDLWPILVDLTELESALVNIVLNARDAMPNGGTLRISGRNLPATAETGEGDRVLLSVADSGVGIPKDVLERVFEPFFTTKPVGKGTGLGLSQVHGFATQAGGQVSIKSEVGKGTELQLRFPRAAGDVVADESEAVIAGSGTVLLVEDNPDVSNATTQLLEILGYSVKCVRDVEGALAELDREHFDLVLTDIVMPGADGLTLAQSLKRDKPDLPVVLTTGYSDAIRSREPDFPLLRKPYQLHELSAMLQQFSVPRRAVQPVRS